MESASYRLFDSDAGPGSRATVEVVTGITVEYGEIRRSGDVITWNTAPEVQRAWPLAARIGYVRLDGGKVYRRRVIVVEDWAEVDGP
jgi:hypothetical protein